MTEGPMVSQNFPSKVNIKVEAKSGNKEPLNINSLSRGYKWGWSVRVGVGDNSSIGSTTNPQKLFFFSI